MNNNKKKLGIIGGMGSRAGAVFLKKIIDYSPAVTDQEFLEIIFHNNSAIPDRTRAIVYNEPSPLDGIFKSLDIFNKNDVEAVALTCMTSYYYYDKISERSRANVINPLQLIARAIKENYQGVKRVGLLATTGSISTGIFHAALKSCNVDVITLDPLSQEELFMRSVYMKNGFKSAAISTEAVNLMFQSLEKLLEYDVDLTIGGCTEVSIGIDPKTLGVHYIDALDLLAEKTVEYCYNLNTVNI
jgi:aspartate racemase